MHAAEHRALRELHAAARHLARHWSALAGRLAAEATVLESGAGDARALLAELERATAARGLHGRPAAQGLGGTVAGLRSAVVDRTLEVNQALRLAALDAQQVVTLLGYLERLAQTRGDGELRELHARWGRRMAEHERRARTAAVALGEDPARAITEAIPDASGRAGHAVAYALGSVGEAVDRLLAGRRGSG